MKIYHILALLFLVTRLHGQSFSKEAKIEDLLVAVNKQCDSAGVPVFTKERLVISVLMGISQRLDPLPKNEWSGEMRSFVEIFKNNGIAKLATKVQVTEDASVAFTDEKSGDEFNIKTEKYRVISLRIFDPNEERGMLHWVDIPLFFYVVNERGAKKD